MPVGTPPYQPPSREELAAILLLDRMKFFGPQKFRELFRQGIVPSHALLDPSAVIAPGKRWASLRDQIGAIGASDWQDARDRAGRYLDAADKNQVKLIGYSSELYPPVLAESNYPVPLLYVRGSAQVLTQPRTVACVGSRKIREPYVRLHREFASAACEAGFVVVSGFAMGADTIGHRAAFEHGGATVAVMPGGLDRPFPPENKGLWSELLAYDKAAFVSEAPIGVRASALTLRKRNKLIVALSTGVLVSQTSDKGGAMNAYRFAVEDHKPVATFAPDGAPDTSGNEVIQRDPKAQPYTLSRLSKPGEYASWLGTLGSLI